MINKNPDESAFTPNFKTRICRHFELGKCKLSGLCNFAHGQNELNFYQKMAQIDEQSGRTIETCSKPKPETSLQKIEKMKFYLDNFYHEQTRIFDQMKLLSMNIKSGTMRNDETLSRMETNIASLYNGAVQYTNEIGRTMEVTSLPGKVIDSIFDQEHNKRSTDKSVKSNTIDFLDDLDEPKLELVKMQLQYIISNLESFKWKPKTQQFQHLSSAKSAFENNQLLEASKQLEKILFDKTMDRQTAETCDKIFKEATVRRF